MVAKVSTSAFSGISVTEVEVQVHVAAGLPAFTIVGLPDKAVAESRERVRAAIQALGLALPAKRITINLAPADLAKEGSHFDLPIAVGLLVAMEVIPQDAIDAYWVMGEVSLDARIQPVNGVLPAAMAAFQAGKGMICPKACGSEAAWAGDAAKVLAPDSILALINHIQGHQVLSSPAPRQQEAATARVDLQEVRGQESAKRALEIAAAGGHNLLMNGPPGAGKSMLAACMPGILPPMEASEILEASTIASVAGQLKEGRLSNQRPYRDPHHSSSVAAMVGGGRKASPGEISLAHNGVLFLDELPEFPRGVLESMRQPLETGEVSVARAQAHVTYPARFQLIAAMNPCRCGYLDDAGRACNKAPKCAVDYQGKLSGPLLDRIDMHIHVAAVDPLDMLRQQAGEPSAVVAERVAQARTLQRERYADLPNHIRINAHLSGDALQARCAIEPEAQSLLEEATQKWQFSMRTLTRMMRVARTIADISASETVTRMHMAEALHYRQLDARSMFMRNSA